MHAHRYTHVCTYTIYKCLHTHAHSLTHTSKDLESFHHYFSPENKWTAFAKELGENVPVPETQSISETQTTLFLFAHEMF